MKYFWVSKRIKGGSKVAFCQKREFDFMHLLLLPFLPLIFWYGFNHWCNKMGRIDFGLGQMRRVGGLNLAKVWPSSMLECIIWCSISKSITMAHSIWILTTLILTTEITPISAADWQWRASRYFPHMYGSLMISVIKLSNKSYYMGHTSSQN